MKFNELLGLIMNRVFEYNYDNIPLSTTPTKEQREAKKAYKEAQKVAATQTNSTPAACPIIRL